MSIPNQIHTATRDANSAPTKNQMYWIKKYLPNDWHTVSTTKQASLIIEAYSGLSLEKK